MSEKELNALITKLIGLPKENEYVEFKDSNYKHDEIGKRISALANGAALVGQKNGYLVFGIEDASHQIVGTKFKPTHEKLGNEEFELWLSRMLSPRIDIRMYEFIVQGKPIALIHIPAATNQPVLFQNTAYIRVGSNTKLLREYPDKERKLWQKPSSEFESEIALSNASGTDVVSLLDTQMVFDALIKLPYPTTQAGVIEKLLEEKLIVRSNGYYHITNLGALLFAKDLRSFNLERKAPRVIKYKGRGKLQTEKDQIGVMGYASGFLRLINYISGLLPSNEVIEMAIRKDIQMYPPLAIRELVANAIIHQDFREAGTYLTIEIYDDRVEISNPGLPILDPIRFIDGYNARNQIFANAMRRMGYCEEKGSGIDKVVGLCEVFQLPPPDFRVNLNQTVAVLFAHQELNQMDRNDKIRACYQHCCLMYVTNQKMTNQSLRERFKIEEHNYAIASRFIKETIGVGLIKTENPDSNSKKYMRYIPYWA